MPARRTILAADAGLRLERVEAPAHGSTWGALHQAPDWRWVLPGSGGVQMRSGGDTLLVDELTAFHLRGGEPYQLQHARERRHVVVSTPSPGALPAGPRAWLVAPRELYQLRLACRPGHAGLAARDAAASARQALRRSVALPVQGVPPALDRARRFIAAQPAAGHRLAEVGEAAHASAFHLARLFTRHLATTPHQYRLRLRLAVALAHLEQGERDLAGLAHALGFAGQSHFGALFRREVGVTPAQARRSLAG